MSAVVHASAPLLTDSRLAALSAEAAHRAFRRYLEQFDAITRQARERFLARDWPGNYADAAKRLHLYSIVLNDLTKEIENLLGARLCERTLWAAIKAVYSALIAQSAAWEIGESFFNSLTRRVFATEGVDQTIEFVDTDFDAPPTTSTTGHRGVYENAPLADLLFEALTTTSAGGFDEGCWHDLRSEVRLAAARIEGAFPDAKLPSGVRLELVTSAFYRGRGSFLVGRARAGETAVSIALALRHAEDKGVSLDAVLTGERELSILFSYTRAYFRVNVECPFELVRYLRELMPGKRLVDLYNAIGFHRHGKTELYRDFVAHLRRSEDSFVAAEGTRGMVMLVFTLPSYDVVFKLIRDRFDFPKDSSRREVKQRYRLVFEHDRAGRLIEAHEFEHLRLARARFDPALLVELLRDAADTVRLEGDDVVVAHAYVERRIRPLNLFFREAEAEGAVAAARDYGQSIKDLAASNIFPGDLLTKNFGVTRNGRVVFYDYDELCFITDCNFRDLPQPTTPEQEMAAEPWYSVRDNDIFPEEFPNFLGMPEVAREALLGRHADLFHAEYWRGVQRELKAGEIPELLPYGAECQLPSPVGGPELL